MIKLDVKNAAKWFGSRKVFDNISFGLEQGRSISITGPNGSGKTTLIRLIIGLTVPTRGEIIYSDNGKKLEFENYRKYLSLVGPYLSLYGVLSARENLRFISKFKLGINRKYFIYIIKYRIDSPACKLIDRSICCVAIYTLSYTS